MNTAIDAIKAKKIVQPTVLTYANILLRPQPRGGSKFSPIKLTNGEANCVFELLGMDWAKWRWVVGSDHTRYIYNQGEDGTVKITSVSGFYSGAVKNRFNVIGASGNRWLKVETLKAGTDWYKNPIPSYLAHHVYSFKGSLPKCGDVILPVITINGWAWIERWQVI